MDLQQWEEIVACLPAERTLFTYFKDQYAIYLLEQQLRAGPSSIQRLRASGWRKLLDKPLLKGALSGCGDGVLRMENLRALGMPDAYPYVLTLGRWGDRHAYPWGQMSRPGVNLVLQLNLPNQIDRRCQTVVGSAINDLAPYSHPYSHKRPVTLAWARLDLDFITGELLIEEIQSDLIRLLARLRQRALMSRPAADGYCHWGDRKIDRYAVVRFCEQVINEQKKLWAEAMLAASVWFAQQELGLFRIFYHTYDTGRVMKNIRGSGPPLSLYSDLPEQFCFARTREAPRFILADRKAGRCLRKIQDAQWYLLTQ